MLQGTYRRRILLTLAVGTQLAACSSPPTGTGGGGPQMDLEIKPVPSFVTDIQEIFVRGGCTVDCHLGDNGGLTLNFDASSNYAELVNVPAEGEDFLRVEPFNPDSSYLVIKLEGRNTFGSRMPPGQQLHIIDRTNIRNWIDNGAPAG